MTFYTFQSQKNILKGIPDRFQLSPTFDFGRGNKLKREMHQPLGKHQVSLSDVVGGESINRDKFTVRIAFGRLRNKQKNNQKQKTPSRLKRHDLDLCC